MQLKTFRGVGREDRQPSKKDEGFLCIEKLKTQSGDDTPHFLAYRNYLGSTQFTSLIVKKSAKIKDEDVNGKIRSKFAVGVKDPATGKYELEYVQIRFFTEADRQVFTQVYKKLAGLQ